MYTIKICGITRNHDYIQAVTRGAAYIGFIFYKASPRYISPFVAAQIPSFHHPTFALPSHQRVGVFVNESIQQVRRIFRIARLDIVQLHGDESPHYVQQLALPCWKAIRVQNLSSIQQIPAYPCDTILLDTYVKDQYGGTGQSFPIEISCAALTMGKHIIISGGISPQNIHHWLTLPYSFYAFDINSGIEESPGQKSPAQLAALFSALQNYK